MTTMTTMTNGRMALHPRGIPELLDATLWFYRQHFWFLIGLVAVVQVPLTVLSLLYGIIGPSANPVDSYFWEYGYPPASQAEVWGGLLGQLALLLLTAIFLYGLANAAVTRAVYDRYLGRAPDFWETYRALGRRWLRLAGVILVVFLLDFILLLVFFLLGMVLMFIPCIGLLSIPLLFAMFLLFLYLNVSLWSPLAGVVVVEDLGVWASVKRAFHLGRKKFWRALGFNLVLGLLVAVFMWTGPFLLTLGLLGLQPSLEIAAPLASATELLLSLIVWPPVFCGLAMLYFDLRARLEGLDLELEMQRMVRDGDGASVV